MLKIRNSGGRSTAALAVFLDKFDMSESEQNYDRYADLIGVVFVSMAVSYLGYLGLRDSETGEIRYLNILLLSIVLHFGSYLLSYFLFRRDHYLRIPRWVLVALTGSVLCAITFRLPVNDVYLDGVLVGIMIFSLIALMVMGAVRFIYWLLRRAHSEPRRLTKPCS
jgi:hypothetical protein